MELDDALGKLGKYGRWQMMYFLIISLASCIPSSFQLLSIVFIGAEPGYHCKIPDVLPKNQSIPKEVVNGQLQYSKCLMYDVSPNTSSVTNTTAAVPCKNGYEFNLEMYGPTFITDYEMVCDRGVLAQTPQTVFTLGIVAGALVFTWFADRYGRKPTFLCALWGMVIMGLVSAFAPNYEVFVASRFFCGAFEQGILLPGFVMACELFPARQRTAAGMVNQVFWPVGSMLMALMAYYIKHWRYLQMAISLFPVLTIPLYWILPESMCWLVANGKYKEAEEILRKAAKMNKVEMPEDILSNRPEMAAMLSKEKDGFNSTEHAHGGRVTRSSFIGSTENGGRVNTRKSFIGSSQNGGLVTGTPFIGSVVSFATITGDREITQPQQASLLDVVKSPKLLLYTLVMAALWLVNAMVYLGISLNAGNIGGDLYVNFTISSIVEMFGFIICIDLLQRFGRRRPIVIFHIIAGISLLIIIPIRALSDSLGTLTVVLAMIGKAGISASFGSVFLFATEIYPTTTRGLCLGICSVGMTIGSICAPYSIFLAKIIWWFPDAVFGVLSVVAGLLTLLLPETVNQPLPQTISDTMKFTKTVTRNRDKVQTVELQYCHPGEKRKHPQKV